MKEEYQKKTKLKMWVQRGKINNCIVTPVPSNTENKYHWCKMTFLQVEVLFLVTEKLESNLSCSYYQYCLLLYINNNWILIYYYYILIIALLYVKIFAVQQRLLFQFGFNKSNTIKFNYSLKGMHTYLIHPYKLFLPISTSCLVILLYI